MLFVTGSFLKLDLAKGEVELDWLVKKLALMKARLGTLSRGCLTRESSWRLGLVGW